MQNDEGVDREYNGNLQVIDTSKALTIEELQELKKLAALSRGAKFIFAAILGAASLFGIDHIMEAISKGHS